ncbi:magnesium transporter [Pseudomonadota bacterium]|nr:magnesium transporter [Pseudomonadota bacterium]
METYNQEKIFEILSKKSEDKFIQIQRILSKMDSHEIAHCLESTPSEQRKVIWSIIDKSNEADVLSELGEEIQQDLFDEISNEELLDLVQNLELDEMVDILQNLPQQRISFLLSKMTKIDRERVEMVLEYPEDSAGGLLNNDIISVQQDSTLNLVLEYLRSIGDIPENTDKLFVVSKNNNFIGELKISKIISSNPELKVSDVMNDKPHSFMVNESDKEVSKFFEQNDLISAAVVNDKNELIGRITIDDVVDVIIEDADQNFLSMAGIAEDTFSPPARAARKRIVWLGLNLITAFVAALAINIFQDAIDKIVYLAVLMPIVASMGGVAATQTLTIVLRGLTLEQISNSNLGWLFKRELAVAILNGIILSFIISLVTYVWFNQLILSALIAAAMIINLLSSVVAGVFVPIILRRLNQDPAIAGSVIVTTVTDVVGFVSFLGLATIFLL